MNIYLCYLHHIGRRYWDLLNKHGFLTGSIANETLCPMTMHYQFFREIILSIEKGGSFVSLSDERSLIFACDGIQGKRGLMHLLLSFVPDHLQEGVAKVSIQQVVSENIDYGKHAWVEEFEIKYAMAD